MKRLSVFVLAMLLTGSLAFAQATGGTTKTTETPKTAETGKKATKTKKGHKGGKKGKKSSGGTTTPAPK
jgi:hypothetical protein